MAYGLKASSCNPLNENLNDFIDPYLVIVKNAIVHVGENSNLGLKQGHSVYK